MKVVGKGGVVHNCQEAYSDLRTLLSGLVTPQDELHFGQSIYEPCRERVQKRFSPYSTEWIAKNGNPGELKFD